MNGTDVQMLTRASLHSRAECERVLDALESSGLPPSHWGTSEPMKNRYGRKGFLDAVDDEPDAFMVLLRNDKAPKYQAMLTNRLVDLSSIKFSFTGKLSTTALLKVFHCADAVAEALEPVFGGVNVVDDTVSSEYAMVTRAKAEWVQQYGPVALCARTWFGPDILRLVQRAQLEDSGAEVTDTPWGGVCIDLLPEPWTHTPAELSAQHERVMARLRPTGIFGDYSKPFKYAAGNNWVAPSRTQSELR